jgi:hypothetical protein
MVTILFALCFNLIRVAMAAAACEGSVPTSPGDSKVTDDWNNIRIIAEYTKPIVDAIAPSYPVSLHLQLNGVACPTYTWSTSSIGYRLSATTTTKSSEKVTLTQYINGTCGTDFDAAAIVTVTDQCGNSDTIVIWNSAGQWTIDTIATTYFYCINDSDPSKFFLVGCDTAGGGYAGREAPDERHGCSIDNTYNEFQTKIYFDETGPYFYKFFAAHSVDCPDGYTHVSGEHAYPLITDPRAIAFMKMVDENGGKVHIVYAMESQKVISMDVWYEINENGYVKTWHQYLGQPANWDFRAIYTVAKIRLTCP